MQHITKLKIALVHFVCDEEDKSTEFTLQYIQDTCAVNLETVTAYLGLPYNEQVKLRKEVYQLNDVLQKIADSNIFKTNT